MNIAARPRSNRRRRRWGFGPLRHHDITKGKNIMKLKKKAVAAVTTSRTSSTAIFRGWRAGYAQALADVEKAIDDQTNKESNN
jgi:hypothetical protein